MRKSLLMVIPLLLISGCVTQEPAGTQSQVFGAQDEQPEATGERVTFQTRDGYQIFGTLHTNPGSPPLILLHMLSGDRHEWDSFSAELKENFTVLSIDLRGHGESNMAGGERVSWQAFSPEDFSNMKLDVAAAKEFLRDRGVSTSTLGLIGASIGANVALNYAAGDGDVKVLVLLSPSLNYRGVKTHTAIKAYQNSLLIVASQEDTQSYKDVSALMSQSPSKDKRLKLYQNLNHGTRMLGKEDVNQLIAGWLEERLK